MDGATEEPITPKAQEIIQHIIRQLAARHLRPRLGLCSLLYLPYFLLPPPAVLTTPFSTSLRLRLVRTALHQYGTAKSINKHVQAILPGQNPDPISVAIIREGNGNRPLTPNTRRAAQ